MGKARQPRTGAEYLDWRPGEGRCAMCEAGDGEPVPPVELVKSRRLPTWFVRGLFGAWVRRRDRHRLPDVDLCQECKRTLQEELNGNAGVRDVG